VFVCVDTSKSVKSVINVTPEKQEILQNVFLSEEIKNQRPIKESWRIFFTSHL
jgi:hypothetical protein